VKAGIVTLAVALAAAPAWDIRVGPREEPGQPLVIVGHVRQDRGTPGLAGMRVYAYHADARGDYFLPGHDREGPRLRGTAVTNDKGEFRITTTMPGTYEGGPPHVHFEVWGEKTPRMAFVMNLMPPVKAKPDSGSFYDRYMSQRAAPTAAPTSAWATHPLLEDAHGVLHGGYEIYLKWGIKMPAKK